MSWARRSRATTAAPNAPRVALSMTCRRLATLRAETRERCPELGVLHRSGPFSHPRHDGGIGWGDRLGRRPRGDRALHQPDVVDHPVPEKRVHALDQLAAAMLDLERGRTGHAQAEHLAGSRRAGPLYARTRATARQQRLGLGEARQVGTDDGRPLGAQPRDRGAFACLGTVSGDTGCKPLGQTADGAEAVFAHGPFQTPFLMVGHGPLHDHYPRLTFACLVRPTSSHPAVARAGRGAHPALPGVAVGDHAAADHRGHGRRLFPPLRRTLAHGRGAGGGPARPCSLGLGRPRLLRPRPQSPCLRPGRGRTPWRALPGGRGGPAGAARHRPLHGRRHPRHRLRPAGLGGRRQCRAGDRPPVRHRDAAARRQARDPAARRQAGARSSAPATTPRR